MFALWSGYWCSLYYVIPVLQHCLLTLQSIPLGFACAAQLPSAVDSFTVPLHSPSGRQLPAVRAVQRDGHWGMKNSGNSHWSREPIMQWCTRQSQSIYRPTNHKRMMAANWRPCLIPRWQSYCHQARTVWQSTSAISRWLSRWPCLVWAGQGELNPAEPHCYQLVVETISSIYTKPNLLLLYKPGALNPISFNHYYLNNEQTNSGTP